MIDTNEAWRYRQKGDLQWQYTERKEVANHTYNEMQTLKVDTACAWSPYDAFDMPGTLDTSCGNLFSFTEDGIKENNFKFCPYCGGEIIEISPPKKPD